MPMNSMEASLLLFNAEPTTRARLRDLVLSTFAAGLTDGSHDEPDSEVLGDLVNAYKSALVAHANENGRDIETFVTQADAERYWFEGARAGYRAILPNEPDDSEAFPSWPDCLRFTNDYPRTLVRDLGYLAGYHDGRQAKTYYEFARQHAV